jgi:penicillin amidase
VAAAMGAACERLEDDLGGDPAGWSWGEAHPLRLQHPFARSSRLLSGWNMPEVPFPGTSTTVAAAGYSWSRPEMKVGGMASLRLVMPLSDLSASTAAHPGGQSGHPGHPDYATHFEAFVGGDRLPLLFDDDDVAARAREVLVLEP